MDLKNLISVAPLPDELKKQLLTVTETASEDKKVEIEQFCWDAILADSALKKQEKVSKIMQGVKEGKRKYSEEDIAGIDGEIFAELTSKMEGVNTAGQIEEVREKLQTPPQKPS